MIVVHFLIVLAALLTSAAGSMLGLGGSFILVPVLNIFFHIPMHMAVATGIVMVIGTSISSSARYLKSGYTNLPLALALEVPTVLGALAGSILAVYAPARILQLMLGCLLFYLAFSMLVRRDPEEDGVTPTIDGYRLEALPRKSLALLLSFFAGGISGALGIGGGNVQVPVMVSVLKVPMKMAIATSAFMIGITAVAPTIVYISQHLVYSRLAGLCLIGSLLGARAGSWLSLRMHSRFLRYLFCALLLVMSIHMVKG